jgi:tRNA (guanine37-N1)-methyltransferase
MQFTIVTLFPEMIDAVVRHGVLGRALQTGVATLRTVQLRDFATDIHRSVDDTPAGGGAGMVLKVDVVAAAVRAAIAAAHDVAASETQVLFLDARGPVFDQACARGLAARIRHIVLVCGRYEGFDHRAFGVRYEVPTGLLSVGDLVLSGGELSALVVTDAVVRLLPGALGNAQSALEESHAGDGLLEHRHYTRPVVFEGQRIPAVLLSGDHKRIAQARAKDGLLLTRALRPDLFVRRRRAKAQEKLLADDRVASLDPEPAPPREGGD